MKKMMHVVFCCMAAALLLVHAGTAMAATNQATDPGGGGINLVSSGTVTINSTAALQLVKQVYDAGGNCLASSPSDAGCNSGATTIAVPSGTALRFMIFVRNISDVTLYDVRMQDVLDTSGTGFAYTGSSIRNDATQNDVVTSQIVYNNVAAPNGTPRSDAVGAGPPDDIASYVGGTLTVGAATNLAVDVAPHTTFAVLFQATKN